MGETKAVSDGLLSARISELALSITGTRLEPLINQVYRELDGKGISFKPATYLSDEWGCPSRVPVIGIPFYLASPALCALEEEITGVEAESDAEVLSYLRHEVGHAFNYAYRLYGKRSWTVTFGSFSRSYDDYYRPVPFSMKYVRYTPGWYAQKHPDDDFAETFGVWLDPDSSWRERYEGTTALKKLDYVDQAAVKYGGQTPKVTTGQLDMPVEEMTMTLDSWYEMCRKAPGDRPSLPGPVDNDLRRLFPASDGQPAVEAFKANRRTLVRDVNYWTGVNRHLVAGLIDELGERVLALDLKVARVQDPVDLARTSMFVTALATNYLRYGRFIPE